jgi:hypothetical protein
MYLLGKLPGYDFVIVATGELTLVRRQYRNVVAEVICAGGPQSGQRDLELGDAERTLAVGICAPCSGKESRRPYACS